MGHEIKYLEYDEPINKKAIEADINSYVRKACWEEGGSGLCSPIRWIDHTCLNREEARQYIDAHDNDRYDQLAVKFRRYEKIEPSKTLLLLKERLKKEQDKKIEYAKNHSVSTFKAEFVGCPECGYKLKRTLLKSESCPLCRAELRGKTTIETLARYEANIRDLQKQINAEERKLEEKNLKKSKIAWLIKIEYHM